MERWQAVRIQKNLNFLTRNTNCSSTFLAVLQEHDVLSDSDYSRLEAKLKSDGSISQSKLLYDILTTRTGGYEAIVEALRETSQTGSLHLLEQAIEEDYTDVDSVQTSPGNANHSLSTNAILEDVYSVLRDKWNRKQGLISSIEWVPSESVADRISELSPAGREDCTLYVARALHEGEWVPGKFLIGSDGIYRAYIPYYGIEYEYHDFQVLIAPPGIITWVEAQPKNIPKHAVVAGNDPAVMKPTYICRVWHDGKLIVGKVLRNSEKCFIPYFRNT